MLFHSMRYRFGRVVGEASG